MVENNGESTPRKVAEFAAQPKKEEVRNGTQGVSRDSLKGS